MLEDPHQAIEWLMQLTSVTPTDAQVLAKLGDLYDNEGDKSQAFQYYYEVKKERLQLTFFVDNFWVFKLLKERELSEVAFKISVLFISVIQVFSLKH